MTSTRKNPADPRPTYFNHYTPGDRDATIRRENPVTGEEWECDLRIAGIYIPGDPGRTWGAPEDCWPSEPDDVEEFQAWISRHGCWVEYTDKLTDKERDALEEEIAEASRNDDSGCDYDDSTDDYEPEYSYYHY